MKQIGKYNRKIKNHNGNCQRLGIKNNSNAEKKRLSIIIPMYNAEKWISRCMESILVQSFRDFEVIIINDGSTDQSLNIVNNYCRTDRRVRCISTKNQGSAKAKNVGLKYRSGDLVTFVDADDFIEAEMYETMISVLDNFHADIVECACRKINIFGRKLYNLDLINEEIEGNEQCALHFIKQENTRNYMCNKIYKSWLFENINFPLLRYSEDYYMNAILHSKINKKVIISQVFYNYMIYPGQSTANRFIDVKRIDGIKAGNMVADYFFYDKRLKTYAGLYACSYGVFMADNMHRFERKGRKGLIKHMSPHLIKALTCISFGLLHDEGEKKIVYQCLLLLDVNNLFFDFRWMLE